MADLSNVNVKIPGHQQKNVANKQENSNPQSVEHEEKYQKFQNKTKYDEALYAHMKREEGVETQLYPDSVPLPTIGIGYCLGRRSWQKEFKEAGINLSQKQDEDIKSLINSVKGKSYKEAEAIIKKYNQKPDALKINETQFRNLYDLVLPKFEEEIENGLGSKIYKELENSHEKLALMSIVYNMGEMGPKLTSAVKENNRAKAFYEIRYGSNKHRRVPNNDLANRRMRESDEFGLYKDKNNVKIEEALDAVEVLDPKRREIRQYFQECNLLQKNEYESLRQTDLDVDTQLKPANELLLNKLSDLIVKSNPAKFSHEDVKNQLNKALKEQKINTKELFENITNQLSNKLGISKQNPSDKNEYLQTQYNELLKHAGGNLQIQNLEFANKKLLDEAIQVQNQAASQSQSVGLGQ